MNEKRLVQDQTFSRKTPHASHHPVDFSLMYRAVGFLDDWQLIQNNCSLRFPFFKTRKTMVPTTTRVIKIFFRDSIGVDRRRNTAR